MVNSLREWAGYGRYFPVTPCYKIDYCTLEIWYCLNWYCRCSHGHIWQSFLYSSDNQEISCALLKTINRNEFCVDCCVHAGLRTSWAAAPNFSEDVLSRTLPQILCQHPNNSWPSCMRDFTPHVNTSPWKNLVHPERICAKAIQFYV